MAIELATAYISILPETSKIAPGVNKALGGVEKDAEKSGQSWGSRLSSGIGKTLKAGAAVAGGAVAGIMGTALVKGFGRLNAIDQAEAKLRGLGHSAKTITGIMDNALASVKGTAFGLDEAASTAAGAVAAGIKPGIELERVLKLTGDTATIAGSSMTEMGSIFNKVAASNRLSMAEVNQLSDRGVPIMQMLAEQYGVTAAEARKMVEQGKVDFADFSTAIEDNIAGAALQSGETFSGAFANMGAALGRVGAKLLGGIFPQIKGGFGGITAALDNLGPIAEQVGEKIGKGLQWAVDAGKALYDFFVKGDFSSAFREAFGIEEDSRIVSFLLGLRETAVSVFNEVKGAISAFVGAWKANDGDITSSGLPGFMERLAFGIRDVIDWLKSAVTWLYDNRELVKTLGAAVLGAVVAFKAFSIIQTVITNVKGAIAAFKAFGAVLAANPIGLIVVAIGALVGALIYLYNNNETVKNAIDAAWAAIKGAVSAVVDWFKDTAWPAISAFWEQLKAGAGNLWTVLKAAWDGIKGAISAVVSWLTDTAWPLIKGVFDKIGAAVKFLYENFIRPQWVLMKLIIESVVDWLRNTAWPFIKDVWDKIGAGVKALYDTLIKPAWDNIKTGIEIVVSWLTGTAWPFIKDVWDKIGAGASTLWEKWIKPAFDSMKSGVETVVTAFGKAKEAIANVWDKVKDAVMSPIKTALEWLNDKFIKPLNGIFEKLGMSLRIPVIQLADGGMVGAGGPMLAMASGGRVPGYSPHARADNIPAMLTAGEYVLPVRSTARLMKEVGAHGLEMLRRGILPRFASGGLVGAAWDWAKNKASDVIDAGTALARLVTEGPKKVLEELLGKIAGSLLNNPLAQVGLAAARKAIEGIASKISEWLGSEGGGTRAGGGMGWRAMQAWFEATFPGQRITSGYRPGAVSVTGVTSDHALGRAIDMPPSMAIFNAIDKTWANIRQLLYSPAGGRQIRGYQRSDTTGALRAQHWDHVHWAMADGGLVKPLLFDQGGYLPRGLSLVSNQTGKPEPLSRADQMRLHPDDMRALAGVLGEVVGPAVEFGASRGMTTIARGLVAH